MNILHLGKFYYPVEGGIESVCKYIVEALPEHNHYVLCFNTCDHTKVCKVGSALVLRAAIYATILRQPISFAYLTLLRRVLRQYKIDIVHLHYPNILASFFVLNVIPKDVSLVVHWHSDIVAQNRFRFLFGWIEKLIVRRADTIIVTSPSYAAYSPSLRNESGKIRVIANAIDIRNFTFDDVCKQKVLEIKRKYNYPIIFFIGRHVEYKGITYLLEAKKKVKHPCVLVIAGQGPLTYKLKEKYKDSSIYWLGRISNEEVCYYMYASDIFAFPSITRNEAFGVVLAEAMYCGTPTVTFTIPGSGVNWVSIGGVTGIEVANSDVNALGEAIDMLLSDPYLRKTMGEKARLRVTNNFIMSKVGPQFRELYESITNKKQ